MVPIPFILLLVTTALVLLDGALGTEPLETETPGSLPPADRPRWWLRWAGAGLALGLGAGLHPDVLVAGVLALALPFLWPVPRRVLAAAALASGLALGVAPVTAMNAVASGGRFVLLTASGGHNLYIGHNPEAQPQYALPSGLDEKDIFDSMKKLAEQIEGRAMQAEEVSDYYLRKAVDHVRAHPGQEAALVGRRTLALVNDVEVNTYASFYYQRQISPVLRWSLTFGWVFPLALLGMIGSFTRPRAHLWIPFLTAAASVLLFFYISRLRIGVMPSVGFFMGAGVGTVQRTLRVGRPAQTIGLLLAGIAGALVANRPFLPPDASNEWNKAGGVLRVNHEYAQAELAFRRAIAENPASANAYLNLAVLYRETGRPEEAARADAAAQQLLARDRAAVDSYRRSLEQTGR